MSIQLNPSINDPFDTKTLGQLRQAVFDGLGFTPPLNSHYTHDSLGSLRLKVLTRLGIATANTVVTDTLGNMRQQVSDILGVAVANTVVTDTLVNIRQQVSDILGLAVANNVVTSTVLVMRTWLYNMLGYGAMTTVPPGVIGLLNGFINEAAQTLFHSIEFDQGTTGAPTLITAVDTSQDSVTSSPLDGTAVMQLALGLAKNHYGQEDAQVYIDQSKKYAQDLTARTPANIKARLNAIINEAQQTLFRTIELDSGTASAPAKLVNDADVCQIDATAIVQLATGLAKEAYGKPDGKDYLGMSQKYLADLTARQPVNIKARLNAIINEAQQTLFRTAEVDSGTATAPSKLVNDGDVSQIDATAIVQLATGLAKEAYGKPDGKDYLGMSQKYLADLVRRAPPNIKAIVNNALSDAQNTLQRRFEAQSLAIGFQPATATSGSSQNPTFQGVAGGSFAGFTNGFDIYQPNVMNALSLVNDTDITTLDAEPIFLLALANVKAMLKQEDAKVYYDQYEQYLKDLVKRQPPDAIPLVNRLLKQAQDTLYRMYKVFRMERWFTWTLEEGIRFYGVSQDDDAPLSPPTGVTAAVGAAATAQNMSSARELAAVTILGNGKVLIAGGINNFAASFANLQTADLYDAATGAFTQTGSMAYARYGAMIATLLNGNALVVGGFNGTPLNSAEIYDQSTGTFSVTGSMSTTRQGSTLTTLQSGKVLICGGLNAANAAQATAEIFDPGTGTFTATGSMGTARYAHSATLLPSGLVLIAGGNLTPTATAELYNPVTGTFAATGSMGTARRGQGAILLGNGQVLLAGGVTSGVNATATAELYDPAAGAFSSTGVMASARWSYMMSLLPNGNVLVAGGITGFSTIYSSTEVYSPAAATFSAGGAMPYALTGTYAVLLNNTVMIPGGSDNTDNLATAILYNYLTNTFSFTGNLTAGTPYYRVVAYTSTGPQIVGGIVTTISPGNTLPSTQGVGTGSITTTVMTITAMTSGAFSVGDPITGTGVTAGTTISSFGTGTGGIGTYNVSASQTVAATKITAPEAHVSAVPANTSVTISWTPLIDSHVTAYGIFGRADPLQLIATVDNMTTSYIDQGTIPPNGALPTVNSTGGVGRLDAREITWVGTSQGDNVWRPLTKGPPPITYNGNWTGPAQYYDIRQAIELWPTPADSTWLLRIKGYFQPGGFERDIDRCSIDWQAVYLKALYMAKAHYKQPDAEMTEKELLAYIGNLTAGTHATRRYIPGNEDMRLPNAVRPVLLP